MQDYELLTTCTLQSNRCRLEIPCKKFRSKVIAQTKINITFWNTCSISLSSFLCASRGDLCFFLCLRWFVGTDRRRDGKELNPKANGILPNRSNQPTRQTINFFLFLGQMSFEAFLRQTRGEGSLLLTTQFTVMS